MPVDLRPVDGPTDLGPPQTEKIPPPLLLSHLYLSNVERRQEWDACLKHKIFYRSAWQNWRIKKRSHVPELRSILVFRSYTLSIMKLFAINQMFCKEMAYSTDIQDFKTQEIHNIKLCYIVFITVNMYTFNISFNTIKSLERCSHDFQRTDVELRINKKTSTRNFN